MYWVTGGRKLVLSAEGKYASHREHSEVEHVIPFHQFYMGGVGRRLERVKKIYNLDAQTMSMLTPNFD